MTNVLRLVVPKRDETRRTQAEPFQRTGDVLILPCVRYERIEAREGPAAKRSLNASLAQDPLLQDLTA